MVEDFNKEFADKGIQIEYTRYVNNNDGNLQLDTYLTAGNEIDIYMAYGGTARLYKRIESGLALDMTEGLAARGFEPYEELGNGVSSFVVDDKYYALPTKNENKAWIMANVDMFEEAGIELPLNGWTYSEFYEACQKLTKGEGLDKTYAMFWAFYDPALIRVCLTSTLAPYATYSDETATTTNYDDPIWKKGVQLTYDTIANGYAYGWDDEVADNRSFANTFLEGKCAMAVGSANIRIVRDFETYPHDFKTAMIPFPVPDETYMDKATHGDGGSSGDLICINPKTKFPEECLDFVLWYIKGGMAPLAAGGRIPLWKGFDSDSVVDAVNSGEKEAFDGESLKAYLGASGTKNVFSPHTNKDGEINTIYEEELQAIMYGKKTVDEGLADMKSRADALLKEE